MFQKDKKDKGKSCAAGDSNKQQTECKPRKCFKCRYLDHHIAKFSKPPKDNEKWQKKVCFNERGKSASQKECEIGNNVNDQKIYELMEQMSGDERNPGRYFLVTVRNWPIGF